MDISGLVQTLAVLVEIAITAIGVLIGIQNRKTYGWLIAATFTLFVLFDILRIFTLPVGAVTESIIFLVACLAMLLAAWLVYNERND